MRIETVGAVAMIERRHLGYLLHDGVLFEPGQRARLQRALRLLRVPRRLTSPVDVLSDVLGLGPPAYLYVGVDDVHAAIDFYERALGAEFLWHFRRFGTEVAAVRVSDDGPQVLLAEHRPTPSCLPIWTVPDLDALVARLSAAGFADRGVTDGTPDGPVHVLRDPDGNELGFLQQDRPEALVARYADPANDAAVRKRSSRGS